MKQELTCPHCGCNHMYVESYPVRPDDTVKLSDWDDQRDAVMLNYDEDPLASSRALGLTLCVMFCITAIIIAWLIWG